VNAPATNNMFALWPGDQLNFSIFIKPTFGFVGQHAASETGHIANTNVGRNKWFHMKVQTILTVLTLALLGCDKDVITVEEPKEITPWTIHKNFSDLAKVNITSISTSKFLYTYGPDFFSNINNKDEVSHAFNRLKHPSSARLPISETYYIEIDSKWVRFANSEWPVNNDRSAWVDLTKLASDFAYVNTGTGHLNRHGSIAINDKAQCLIPIITTDLKKDIVAYLFSTQVEDISYVKVTDTIRLNITNPSPVKSQIVYLTKGIKDYFIISVDGGTFKVTGDGQIKKVINTSFDNLFVSQGKLYGLKEPNLVYISENDGETWESLNGFPENSVLAHYSVTTTCLRYGRVTS
jgi:hypothetical protein